MAKATGWTIADAIAARIRLAAEARFQKPTQLVNQILLTWLDREQPDQTDPIMQVHAAHAELHELIKAAYPIGSDERKEIVRLSRELSIALHR
jgi:hypothetical protein